MTERAGEEDGTFRRPLTTGTVRPAVIVDPQ